MKELINIDGFKKKAKLRYVLNIVFLAVILLATIGGTITSLLLSHLDYTVNMIINIVVTVVVGLFIIFYLLNIFPIISHYYTYYKNLNVASLEHHRRLVFFREIENKEINNVKYRVLQFFYQEGEYRYIDNLYVLDNDVKLIEDQAYKVQTYQNVIISYEALS